MSIPTLLQIGDHVSCEKSLGFRHVGVAVGPNQIFHNAPGRGEHISSLVEFAQGRPVQVRRTNADPSLVVARVRARLSSPRPYSALDTNCDHSVTAVLAGEPESPQLQALGAFAALAALIYFGCAQ